MRARKWSALGFVVVVAAALVGAGLAGADDEPAGGLPPLQPKIDNALVKHLDGLWEWTASGMLEGSGTCAWLMALGDTAVVETIEGTVKLGDQERPFHGHGVWKVGADGTSLTTWWFDNLSAGAQVSTGTLSDDGYEVKDEEGQAEILKKVGAGVELSMHGGQMKIKFTKKAD